MDGIIMKMHLQKNKVLSILLVLIFSCLVSGCRTPKVDSILDIGRSTNKKIYFSYNDLENDDHGPGTYVYPDFSKTEDEFDLLKFEVYDAGKFIDFKLNFSGQVNLNSLADHWSYHLIDIYIDTDNIEFSGYTNSLPERNIEFIKNKGWEKVVCIAPFSHENFEEIIDNKTTIPKLREMKEKKELIVPENYIVGNYTLIAKILKKDIGIPKDNWGYQVLVMGFDPNKTGPDEFYNMEIRYVETENNFGGGSNFKGNPAPIDILTPEGYSQEELLSKYKVNSNPESNIYPKIPFVYKEKNNIKSSISKITRINKNIIKLNNNKMSKTIVKVKKDKILKNKLNIFGNVEEKNADECHHNMRMILDAALKYKKEHSKDQNITMFDLLEQGYLPRTLRCPSGGRYIISGENTGNLKVKCLNISGISHGVLKEKGE